MADLIHEFITGQATATPDAIALLHRDELITYAELAGRVSTFARALVAKGVQPGDRIAVFLPKQIDTVVGLFAATAAGASFVPINPLLKAPQVEHILAHSEARILLTAAQRLDALEDALPRCAALEQVVVTGATRAPDTSLDTAITLEQFLTEGQDARADNAPHRRIDLDLAAILYTSGSTGKPKGVALSHRNLVAGANSVASYLHNTAEDRLLAVLPLSFDAGLSQLTTAFSVGASVVLLDYLLPRDVIKAVERYGVTGLAAVPPLWNQLRSQSWPEAAVASLRYITNTGGAMPVATTRALREALPNTEIFLMYGLTEAFRSTYLPPDQVDIRPHSIGRAIPNAEVLVINADGRECGPNEPGELVHRGALVSLGYWNDPEATAMRFRPSPVLADEIPTAELAVWSGDEVTRDEAGYLYFVSRQDDMIKTSGYRVSPTEVEEVVLACGLANEAAALGLPHPDLGQAIAVLVTSIDTALAEDELTAAILAHCRAELPGFMVPRAVLRKDSLPRNPNGKLDRRGLAQNHQDIFSPAIVKL